MRKHGLGGISSRLGADGLRAFGLQAFGLRSAGPRTSGPGRPDGCVSRWRRIGLAAAIAALAGILCTSRLQARFVGLAPGLLDGGLITPARVGNLVTNAARQSMTETNRRSTLPLTPIAVFGEDDRGPVPDELRPTQEMIGLLYNGKAQIVCTAFCVATDVIATAAHCLFRTAEDKPPALADFVFARSQKQTQGTSRIAGFATRSISQNILSGNMQIRVRPPIDAANDWALIRLAAPACDKGVLPVKVLSNEDVAQAAQDKKIFQLSYHRDFGNWELAYSKPCEAGQAFGDVSPGMIARDFTNPQALILHRCDTGGASSGSPLFVTGPGGPFVVGINVGTYVLSRTLVRENGSAQRLRQDVIANTAVNAAVFQPLIAALQDAQVLEGSAQLRRLQQMLHDVHHYSGPIDGAYGALLRAAIQDFQLTQGLPVTGLATLDLLGVLEKASAGRPAPSGSGPQSSTLVPSGASAAAPPPLPLPDARAPGRENSGRR